MMMIDNQVLGWGLLSENGDQPSVLQKVTVPFLPYGQLPPLST